MTSKFHLMNKISNVVIKPMQDSMYIKPLTMHFNQNGKFRKWDLLDVHDSVAIILYNAIRKVLVFVRQFRPAVYFGSIDQVDRIGIIDPAKYPVELGITLEFCAGIIDRNASAELIAKEEVMEECGYEIPIGSLERVGSYRSGVGTLSSIQTMYYCEVNDEMKIGTGGGIDDELIEVVEMTIPEVKEYISQLHILSPPSFLYGVHWFLLHKYK